MPPRKPPKTTTTASNPFSTRITATNASHNPPPSIPHIRANMSHRTTTQANAIPQRPTTPLRTPSRTSFRASHSYTPSGNTGAHPSLSSPLTTLEPAFSELSDALADLEANMTLLQQQHESIARFTENFAAFLYGLDMNAYCVDWVEAPGREAWARQACRKKDAQISQQLLGLKLEDNDALATPRAARGDPRDRTPRKFANGNTGADISVLSTTSARTTTSTATSGTNTSSNIGRGRGAAARRSGIARGRAVTARNGSRIASSSTGTAGTPSVSGFGYGSSSRPASVVSSGTAASTRENGSTAGLRGRGTRGAKTRGYGRGALDGVGAAGIGRGRGRGGGV